MRAYKRPNVQRYKDVTQSNGDGNEFASDPGE